MLKLAYNIAPTAARDQTRPPYARGKSIYEPCNVFCAMFSCYMHRHHTGYLGRNYGLRDVFEVVHVEDVFEWWAGSQGGLPGLLFLGDLLDYLGDGACIDNTKANCMR